MPEDFFQKRVQPPIKNTSNATQHIKATSQETRTALTVLALLCEVMFLSEPHLHDQARSLMLLCDVVDMISTGDDAVKMVDEMMQKLIAHHNLKISMYGITSITPKQHYAYHVLLQLLLHRRNLNSLNPEAYHILAKKAAVLVPLHSHSDHDSQSEFLIKKAVLDAFSNYKLDSKFAEAHTERRRKTLSSADEQHVRVALSAHGIGPVAAGIKRIMALNTSRGELSQHDLVAFDAGASLGIGRITEIFACESFDTFRPVFVLEITKFAQAAQHWTATGLTTYIEHSRVLYPLTYFAESSGLKLHVPCFLRV